MKVVVSVDFLNAFAKIPQVERPAIRELVRRFSQHPLDSSIPYCSIDPPHDDPVQLISVNEHHHLIVFQAPEEGVHILLWVGAPAEALKWIKPRRFMVHPRTGSLQVIHRPYAHQSSQDVNGALFQSLSSAKLLEQGAPESVLHDLHKLNSEEELDQIRYTLPQETHEFLAELATDSISPLPQQEESPLPAPLSAPLPASSPLPSIDSALQHPDSQRRFYVVEDADDLQSLLKTPLESWRIFLHPSQRELVDRDFSGPFRLLGGAGTGKTVVAIHRAKWLAENRLTRPEDRLLFTTFTSNLALEIRESLQRLCSPEAFAKIEVINIDRWALKFLKQEEINKRVIWDTEKFWEEALEAVGRPMQLDVGFFRKEWEQVIQNQEVETLEQYLNLQRAGASIRLDQKERASLWPVIEHYRQRMDKEECFAPSDYIIAARKVLETKGDILPYQSIIVDESQDMGMLAFKLIRQMIPLNRPEHQNDLFIVGDCFQKIYDKEVVLKDCGIEVRGRSKKLKINYRTTEETRKWAVNLLQGVKADNLDGEEDLLKGDISLLRGIPPLIYHCQTQEQEGEFILNHLKNLHSEGMDLRNVCIAARRTHLVDHYEQLVKTCGLPSYRLSKFERDDQDKPGVRLATMHRIKGLEFDHIIVGSVNEGIIPQPKFNENREKSLLYVAVTRARKEALITSYQNRSPFLTTAVGTLSHSKPLTILFSDVKDSTELYDRAGDAYAYNLIQEHFQILAGIIHGHHGELVKTIGDAVMAVFPSPEEGIRAALEMMERIASMNQSKTHYHLWLKIGLHHGFTLAVNNKGVFDYFGQSVNIAARIQAEANAGEICMSEAVQQHANVHKHLYNSAYQGQPEKVSLKGLSQKQSIYRYSPSSPQG